MHEVFQEHERQRLSRLKFLLLIITFVSLCLLVRQGCDQFREFCQNLGIVFGEVTVKCYFKLLHAADRHAFLPEFFITPWPNNVCVLGGC